MAKVWSGLRWVGAFLVAFIVGGIVNLLAVHFSGKWFGYSYTVYAHAVAAGSAAGTFTMALLVKREHMLTGALVFGVILTLADVGDGCFHLLKHDAKSLMIFDVLGDLMGAVLVYMPLRHAARLRQGVRTHW